MKLFRFASVVFLLRSFTACTTLGPSSGQITQARAPMLEEIKNEPRDAYYVGRRYYKTEYKFWGFVRQSGHPWSEAKLVMLNENQKLAPDRNSPKLGSDNNFEYKLQGYYSGDTVYEPASNGMYPEFVLKGHELRTTTPAPIYREPGATDPERRIVARPY